MRRNAEQGVGGCGAAAAGVIVIAMRVAVVATVLAHCVPYASAATSFGDVMPLHPNAATDHVTELGSDHVPAIAAAPSGVVIATWSSTDFGAPANMGYSDILYVRSTDGGESWSLPAVLNSQVFGIAQIATDGQGTWIVVVSGGSGVRVVRSVDDGLSWSAPQPFPNTEGANFPTVVFDGNQTWIVAWEYDVPPTNENDIGYSRSTDGGLTWSAPEPFAFNSPSSSSRLALAADGAGTWVALWVEGASPYFSRSTDNGFTWTPTEYFGSGIYSGSPDVSVVHQGNDVWLAVWAMITAEDYFSLRFRRSIDGGATWSPEAPIFPEGSRYRGVASSPAFAQGPNGRLSVLWSYSFESFGGTKGRDADLLISDSFDDGATWDPPMLVNSIGQFDGRETDEYRVAATTTSSGRTIAVFESNNDLGGTIGTDVDILVTSSVEDCPAVPRSGCTTPSSPGASRLFVYDGPGGRDRLKWRWRKGGDVLPAELGDPRTTSSYALCLYAKVGGNVVAAVEEDIPAATTCEGSPCWSALGDGYFHKDPKTRRSSVNSLKLIPGTDGRASIDLKAKGATLGPPSLPIDLSSPAKVQLVNTETDACWEATYSTATINSTSRFSAGSD